VSERVETARLSGAMGMVATHWRHAPAYRKARDIVRQSGFGHPAHCEGWFYSPDPSGPIWDAPDGLTAHLLAQGVHLVDCTRFLMGDIKGVYASARTREATFDSCSVCVQFSSGATGTLSMAAHAHYMTGHRLFGVDGGFAEVCNGRQLRCSLAPYWTGQERPNYRDVPCQTWDGGPTWSGVTGAGYLEEFEHFAACLLLGDQPAASLEDGWQALRVLEAIAESARSGNPVAL
jgi:predicted dehydrogenase